MQEPVSLDSDAEVFLEESGNALGTGDVGSKRNVTGTTPMTRYTSICGGTAQDPGVEARAFHLRDELVLFRTNLLAEMRALLSGVENSHKELLGKHEEVQDQHKDLIQRHDHILRMLSAGDFSVPASGANSPTGADSYQKEMGYGITSAATQSEKMGSGLSPAATQSGKLFESEELHTLTVAKTQDQEMMLIAMNSRPSEVGDDDVPSSPGAFGGLGQKKKKHLSQAVYNVYDLYYDKGLAQHIARSPLFEHITLAVISLNAVYLGIDADYNKAATFLEADLVFQFWDHAFCLFFTFEIAIRFASFKEKCKCLYDGWFKFDSFLVMLMISETWITPSLVLVFGIEVKSLPTEPLRLLRLLRLSRLIRLMRSFPELVTMIKGMWVASRAVCSSLLMILMLIYIFAIVLFMMLEEEMSLTSFFGTVPRTMWTLFLDGTLLDGVGDLLRTLLDMGEWNTICSVIVFLFFILLSALTVMNMLVGVLCEVVSTVAQDEKDAAAIRLVKQSILVELKKFDEEGLGLISRAELGKVMTNKHALTVLRSLEVDVACLKELQQMLFVGEDSRVSIDNIMDLLLMYRGPLPVTVKHIVDGQAFTRWYLAAWMQDSFTRLNARMDELSHQIVRSSTGHPRACESVQVAGLHQPSADKSMPAEAESMQNAMALQVNHQGTFSNASIATVPGKSSL